MTFRHGILRHAFLLLVLSLGLGLAGCEGSDGAAGAPGAAGAAGADGADGTDGADGISCWDLNENGVADAGEDLNGDGVVDVDDCSGVAGGAYEPDQLHAGWFATNAYTGTESCLDCHGRIADEFLTTAHFTWEGWSEGIEGRAGELHGKKDILNNFCIGVPTNEARCTQCHAGYGYADATFDFEDPENIDCLVCHDQTFDDVTQLGTYAKAKTTAGLPEAAVDLNAVAQSVAMNGGVPTIKNCIRCHANAGGGDNVKHGDLAMALKNTTREYDVHMGTDGEGFECTTCHTVQRANNDINGEMLSHGIGGMPYHSVDEGRMRGCDDCHSINVHIGTPVEATVQSHDRLACQVCHIPTFARETSTKTEWYWERAGQVVDPIPVDPATGRPTFDRKKGDFVWENNVRPELRYFAGTYEKMIIGVNDTYAIGMGTPENPVVLAEPVGDHNDPSAMIYPFKKMIGNQPADVVNRRILVPHLFGPAGDTDKFWGNWNWDNALLFASNVTGQPYTAGDFGFPYTEMFLSVNHEVAPAEEALGYGGDCGDCHLGGQIDWEALGWQVGPNPGDTADPTDGGVRP